MTQSEKSLNRRWGAFVFKALLRVLLASLLAFVGFYLILMSTMGPAIAPGIWGGRWDIVIRLSELVLGGSLILLSAGWLVFPVVKKLYQAFMKYRMSTK